MAQTVQTVSGPVQGTTARHESVEVFKGIPYAAPPIGDLRWRPPQPVTPWSEVRKCDKFGPKSLQSKDARADNEGEDCLVLNVWTPRNRESEKRPVMVWIHGGGFTRGSGEQATYDGTSFARRGVVLVTINYRLGALGFMTHPELSAESPHHSSGNYAILDQIAALKWVRDNIEMFGGDPNNVTIFGESAGGTSVYLLTATPLSKGLFHRAILQSPWLDPLIFRDLKQPSEYGSSAEIEGLEVSQKLFPDNEGSVLQKLRAIPAEEILQKLKPRWPIAVDGWIFPEAPHLIYAKSNQHDVPLIIGTNRDEGTMFARTDPFGSMENYKAAMFERFGKDADRVVEFYTKKKADVDLKQVATQQITDGWFVQPARECARAMATQKSPVWMYHFTKPISSSMGAAHAAELGYVFGNLGNAASEDSALSDAMMNYWIQFATSGNPNKPGLLNWPGYSTEEDEHLLLDVAIEIGSDLRKEACDLLDGILEIQREGSLETVQQ